MHEQFVKDVDRRESDVPLEAMMYNAPPRPFDALQFVKEVSREEEGDDWITRLSFGLSAAEIAAPFP